MKPRVAVHKFSSCDGCQLAFINAGEDLLKLGAMVDILHFAEAGMCDEEAQVEIAFVEGSVSTPHDVERIKRVRENSAYVITLGACATSGGLQALRNMHDQNEWIAGIYASPEYIDTLPETQPVSDYIKVDYEIWGCPVNPRQVFEVVRSLLFGVAPTLPDEKVCLECKRNGNVCTLVSRGEPCMGPVTRGGCGAICPAMGRDCYACFGPAEAGNADALANRFAGLGLQPEAIARRFAFINNNAPEFKRQAERWMESEHE